MYKIYNNEIKIKQILKGGGIYDETIGGAFGESSSFKPHPLEPELYNVNTGRSKNNFGTPIFKADYVQKDDEKEDHFSKIRPFFGTEIRYEKFDLKMYLSILFTLKLFDANAFKADNLDRTAYNGLTPGQKATIKNNYKFGIACLKQLGLYDHEADEFVDYKTFKDKIGKSKKDQGSFDTEIGKLNDSTDPANVLYNGIFVTEDFVTVGFNNLLDNKLLVLNLPNADTKRLVKQAYYQDNYKNTLIDLYKYTGIKYNDADLFPNASMTNYNNREYFSIGYLYNLCKEAKKIFHNVVNCKKIYYQLVKSDLYSEYLQMRYGPMQGGTIDNLKYILNGGSLNSIIRIPDLSEYFRTQLRIAEQRLKNKNKSLSVSSKNEIVQIIDALEKHEKNLHDQFDLLKNAHLINQDVISLRDDKNELVKAKSSLRKYMKYNNGLYDIVRNIMEITDEISSSKKSKKGIFEDD